MTHTIKTMNRRAFLARSAELSLGSASLFGTLGMLNQVNAAVTGGGDYKALVCVFLYGGNDSFNMVVPRSSAEYATYAEARQNLAVSKNQLLPINPLNPGVADYGFHPAMPELQTLFENGRLGVVANVGTLVEHLDRTDFRNKSVPRPPKLFSHNDQQDFWQSMMAGNGAKSGWAGRMADRLLAANANRELAMNITLSGSNLWQVGRTSIPYSMSASGVEMLRGLDPNKNAREASLWETFQALLAADSAPLFGREYARVQERAIALSEQVSGALAGAPPVTAAFPDNKLADSLNMVAQMIAARQGLGQSRQIFFVGFGGWDTHANQRQTHPALLQTLSQSLAAFYNATEALGVADQVTTFTMSDFGRTLTSNGDGSDHGWGGIQLVMGDSVWGRDIYGEMPDLVLEGPADAGRGRIIPTTAVDQYAATLARWFGLSDGDINSVLPNLNRFYSDDLGFMA